MAIRTINSKKKPNFTVQTIDTAKKTIAYDLVPDTDQQKHYSSIKLVGFTKLPQGFYADGFGLTPLCMTVIREIARQYGDKIDLTFHATKKSSIKIQKDRTTVVFNYPEFNLLLEELKAIRTIKNKELKAVAVGFLSKYFPKRFKNNGSNVESHFGYSTDKISKILNSEPNIIDQLSKNDLTMILESYPKVVDRLSLSKQDTTKLLAISQGKNVVEKVVLSSLIKEYQRRLKATRQVESEWQVFFQEHILLFNTAYVGVLGKASVSLQGKYPDFMLVDTFNHVDIFEIKRPNTNLLQFDQSRNNYFWDVELSKAIIQVENYINYLTSNGSEFERAARKLKGLTLNVIKPRGVIIAGTRSQLDNEKKEDDFRLLKNSLKNIEVILFDDFLDRLKNLELRLGKPAAKPKVKSK